MQPQYLATAQIVLANLHNLPFLGFPTNPDICAITPIRPLGCSIIVKKLYHLSTPWPVALPKLFVDRASYNSAMPWSIFTEFEMLPPMVNLGIAVVA